MTTAKEYDISEVSQGLPPVGAFHTTNGHFFGRNAYKFSFMRITTNTTPEKLRVTCRFGIALGVSLLAHLAIVVLPYAGGTAGGAAPSGRLQYQVVATLVNEAGLLKADIPDTPPIADIPESGHARAGGPLPIPAPEFYSPDQLSKRPAPLGDDPLDSSQLSVLASSGTLMIKLWINDLGQVVQAETEKTGLPREFASAAMEAFKQVRFSPGERGGMPVGSVIRIEVRYTDTRRSSS